MFEDGPAEFKGGGGGLKKGGCRSVVPSGIKWVSWLIMVWVWICTRAGTVGMSKEDRVEHFDQTRSFSFLVELEKGSFRHVDAWNNSVLVCSRNIKIQLPLLPVPHRIVSQSSSVHLSAPTHPSSVLPHHPVSSFPPSTGPLLLQKTKHNHFLTPSSSTSYARTSLNNEPWCVSTGSSLKQLKPRTASVANSVR